jgi:hypothetical protein
MEVFTVIKDLIVAGAAITAAIVAVKGLDTWRRQLKGHSEYELSRRILVTLFKYRDAVNDVRHPAMWNYEIPKPSDEEKESMDAGQIRFYGTSKAYQARWEKVQDERTSLYADLLEAEAIWGDDLNNHFKDVFGLQHELFTNIRLYLELINPEVPEHSKEAIRKVDENKRDIMYDNLGEEPDEFKSDLITAIKKIEVYLKPKLNQEKI